MKIIFISLVFLFNFSIEALSQTEEEKKFLDTLKMGGTYLLGKPFVGRSMIYHENPI